MTLLTPLFGLLLEVTKFVNHEKANELKKRVLKLKDLYAQEMAKSSYRDDALIYSIRRELFDICDIYRAELERSTVKD